MSGATMLPLYGQTVRITDERVQLGVVDTRRQVFHPHHEWPLDATLRGDLEAILREVDRILG